jgi:hypothetical protein
MPLCHLTCSLSPCSFWDAMVASPTVSLDKLSFLTTSLHNTADFYLFLSDLILVLWKYAIKCLWCYVILSERCLEPCLRWYYLFCVGTKNGMLNHCLLQFMNLCFAVILFWAFCKLRPALCVWSVLPWFNLYGWTYTSCCLNSWNYF